MTRARVEACKAAHPGEDHIGALRGEGAPIDRGEDAMYDEGYAGNGKEDNHGAVVRAVLWKRCGQGQRSRGAPKRVPANSSSLHLHVLLLRFVRRPDGAENPCCCQGNAAS